MVQKISKEILISENRRISAKFEDSLAYTKHIMRYIGGQIQRNDAAKNYQFINQLLISYRAPSNDIMSWSTFSWVDSNFHLIVSSNEGINLNNFGDLSKRDYIPRTVENPETIQVGSPVYGIKSNIWSIPVGYGIKNKKGEYLGAVVTGIVIDGLQKKLEEIIKNDGVFFAIIDTKDLSVVAKSSEFWTSSLRKVLKEIKLEHQDLISLEDHFYYKKLPNYPYAIVTFYLPKKVHNRLLIYISLITLILVATAVPLILFERKLVKPIRKLARIAKDISLGKEPGSLGKSNIEEIDSLANELRNIQRYKSETAMAKKSQSNFFLNISQELKNPLSEIIIFAEIIAKETHGEVSKDYLVIANKILNSGNNLSILIDNLLYFSQIRSGKIELQKENFILANEISNAANRVLAEADKKNIKIKIDCDCGDELIFADRAMFQNVMINLLLNSVKFAYSDSEIEVLVKMKKGEKFEIMIRDRGLGISKDEMENILKDRENPESNRKNHLQKGVGLGLQIVQKIIALHEGNFEIKSTYGQGTEAILHIPQS